jgi:uncharacterized protein
MMNKQRNRSISRHLRLALLAAITVGSVSALAASFDCDRARLPDEKALCASRQLSEMDVELAVRHQMLTDLVAMDTRGDMQDEQQAWLKTRRECGGNQSCLTNAYRRRIQTLKDEYAHLASRGPLWQLAFTRASLQVDNELQLEHHRQRRSSRLKSLILNLRGRA